MRTVFAEFKARRSHPHQRWHARQFYAGIPRRRRFIPSRPIPWGDRWDEPFKIMLIQTLLIAVSVSMDAFAVSIGKGLTVKKLRGMDAFKTGLWFGGFQALFPLIGYFAASTFSKYVTAADHWIIFVLLAVIGGNMVREAFGEDEENAKKTAEFDWRHMLPLAVACSIDAFAVGVSFAFMELSIWISVVIIGVTTGLFSAAGLSIGRMFGSRWQKPAQIAGGVVLILIGTKVLLEHLGFIA